MNVVILICFIGLYVCGMTACLGIILEWFGHDLPWYKDFIILMFMSTITYRVREDNK